MKGRVLTIAGSDSGGGAGIQADLKAITALGAFGASALTALTAQNTEGVFGVLPIPLEFIAQQIDVVVSDLGVDVVKTGMLHDAAIIRLVAQRLAALSPRPLLVLDPVMVAKGGARLLQEEAREALLSELVPLATVVTPNIPEAEVLVGFTIGSTEEQVRAGEHLRSRHGAANALIKGGHLEGPTVVDVLVTEQGVRLFEGPRLASRSTHGTGCTLASAIAAGLSQGMSLETATERATAYVRRAIETAPGLGRGHGPLNHACLVIDVLDPAR